MSSYPSRIAVACLLFTAIAASRAHAQPAPTSATVADPSINVSQLHRFRVVTVADSLENPWSIAFLPNGDMLVTERPGRLRIIEGGVLRTEPIAGVPAVRARGQGGLLDVVLHPEFAMNQLVYLSFSKPSPDGVQGTTAVVRGRLDGDRLTSVEEIFEAKAWSNGNGHFGSRLAFDGQGHLFITVGDRQAPPSGNLEGHPAQDLSLHQGKVIRIHDDGRVPEDNPFVGRQGALPEIWTFGHRNLQGLTIHPETGDVWEVEHGPQGGDELNLVQPGRNYGWPVIGYGVNYGADRLPIHASGRSQTMEQPVHYWIPSIATSGLLLYTGDAFPAWRGSMFVGGLVGQQVARLSLDGRQVPGGEAILQGIGRVRDVRQGPEGFIYLAIDGRDGAKTPILRLEPIQG